MSDKTLRELQASLPWGAHEYTREFQARTEAHRDLGHALIHIGKALGKLFGLLDDMEHQPPVEAYSAEARAAAGKYLADVLICAARAANTFPMCAIDLQAAYDARVAEKFGTPAVERPDATDKTDAVDAGVAAGNAPVRDVCRPGYAYMVDDASDTTRSGPAPGEGVEMTTHGVCSSHCVQCGQPLAGPTREFGSRADRDPSDRADRFGDRRYIVCPCGATNVFVAGGLVVARLVGTDHVAVAVRAERQAERDECIGLVRAAVVAAEQDEAEISPLDNESKAIAESATVALRGLLESMLLRVTYPGLTNAQIAAAEAERAAKSRLDGVLRVDVDRAGRIVVPCPWCSRQISVEMIGLPQERDNRFGTPQTVRGLRCPYCGRDHRVVDRAAVSP